MLLMCIISKILPETARQISGIPCSQVLLSPIHNTWSIIRCTDWITGYIWLMKGYQRPILIRTNLVIAARTSITLPIRTAHGLALMPKEGLYDFVPIVTRWNQPLHLPSSVKLLIHGDISFW